MKKWLLLLLFAGAGFAFASVTTSCKKEVCPAYRTDKDKVDDSPSPRTTKRGLVKRKRQRTFY